MPFSQIISPTDTSEYDLLIVHANPQDVQQIIFPENMQRYAFTRQFTAPSDDELAALLQDTPQKYIAYGHLHIPGVRTFRTYTLFNIASVSLPMDEDWRAKYAILTFEDEQWQATFHHVEYDAAGVKQALLASDMPTAENFAGQILLPT